MRTFIATALVGSLALSACGGGGGSTLGGGGQITGPASNVQAVTVDAGPGIHPDINTLFTSVTICAPGSTTNCQTIEHIQVDTGSSGLRIIQSALKLTLPQQTDAGGNAVVECTQFADGFSWGPVKTADIQISGESASSAAVQVIGDPAYPNIPSACSSVGSPENDVNSFGANGVLGVGPFISDCGSGCSSAGNPIYYTCPAGGACQSAGVAVAAQVSNPVAFFAADNNGVIVELPALSSNGAATASGSLVFGIGTQSNNGLGSATILTISDTDGSLTTQYKGTALTQSFIDSGSNALFFSDSGIGTCADLKNQFYCPTSTLSLNATMQGMNGTNVPVNFAIANADALLSQSVAIAAANDLGGPGVSSGSLNAAKSFDWGLPFFYGRNVFTAIETRNTAGGMGPYFAF